MSECLTVPAFRATLPWLVGARFGDSGPRAAGQSVEADGRACSPETCSHLPRPLARVFREIRELVSAVLEGKFAAIDTQSGAVQRHGEHLARWTPPFDQLLHRPWTKHPDIPPNPLRIVRLSL